MTLPNYLTGITIATEIEHLLQNTDNLTTSEIQTELSMDISEQTLKQILLHMEEQETIMQYKSEHLDYIRWTHVAPQTTLRSLIQWSHEIGLLDQSISDDLPTIEKLAHLYELADWIDSRPTHKHISTTQNYIALKNQIEAEYTNESQQNEE